MLDNLSDEERAMPYTRPSTALYFAGELDKALCLLKEAQRLRKSGALFDELCGIQLFDNIDTFLAERGT